MISRPGRAGLNPPGTGPGLVTPSPMKSLRPGSGRIPGPTTIQRRRPGHGWPGPGCFSSSDLPPTWLTGNRPPPGSPNRPAGPSGPDRGPSSGAPRCRRGLRARGLVRRLSRRLPGGGRRPPPLQPDDDARPRRPGPHHRLGWLGRHVRPPRRPGAPRLLRSLFIPRAGTLPPSLRPSGFLLLWARCTASGQGRPCAGSSGARRQ